MSFSRTRFAISVLLLASLVAPGLVAGQAKTRPKKKHPAAAKKKADPPPEATAPPPPPPPPPTPEQQPAIAPTVTYQNELLTIVAKNSVLSDVLREVKAKTGANIDVPSNATERVVAQIGPGPARDVLAKLLNGTHFNYVMLGTAANPNAVAKVILTPSTGGEPGPTQASGAPVQLGPQQPNPNQPYPNQPYPNQAYTPPGVQVQNPGDQGGDNSADQDNDANDANQEENTNEQANGDENQQQNPNQPQVKTPEQLLQELQRQQQQQQQGQQNGTPPQPQQPQVQPQVVYPTQPPQQQEEPK